MESSSTRGNLRKNKWSTLGFELGFSAWKLTLGVCFAFQSGATVNFLIGLSFWGRLLHLGLPVAVEIFVPTLLILHRRSVVGFSWFKCLY